VSLHNTVKASAKEKVVFQVCSLDILAVKKQQRIDTSAVLFLRKLIALRTKCMLYGRWVPQLEIASGIALTTSSAVCTGISVCCTRQQYALPRSTASASVITRTFLATVTQQRAKAWHAGRMSASTAAENFEQKIASLTLIAENLFADSARFEPCHFLLSNQIYCLQQKTIKQDCTNAYAHAQTMACGG